MTVLFPLSFLFLFSFWLPNAFLDSCRVSVYPKEPIVPFGGSVKLNCTTDCTNHTKMDWEVSSDKSGIEKGNGWTSLSSTNVTDWTFQPVCFVTVASVPMIEKVPVYVYRFSAPAIDLASEMVADQNETIICKISSLRVRDSIPTHVNISLSSGGNVLNSSHGKQSVEHHFIVHPGQDGEEIVCVASVQVGSEVLSQRANSTLKVWAGPYNINVSQSSRTYVAGAKIKMTCRAEGTPPPVFTWSIPSSSHATFSDDNRTLTIDSAQNSHNGTYRCLAVNKYGNKSSEVNLLFEGKSRSWVTAVVVVSLLAIAFTAGIIWYQCRS